MNLEGRQSFRALPLVVHCVAYTLSLSLTRESANEWGAIPLTEAFTVYLQSIYDGPTTLLCYTSHWNVRTGREGMRT